MTGLDLLLSLITISLATAVSCKVTLRTCQSCSPTTRNLVAVATIALGGLYFWNLWDQIALARLLPTSGLIILGNWFPVFAGILACLVQSQPYSRLRRLVPTAGLLGVGCCAAAYPLLGSQPDCGPDRWENDVCLQTTPTTCSPAAAATLLRAHGIDATEREMARLCLTRKRGTNWMGIYRGLSLKTHGTPWQVEVFEASARELLSEVKSPAILIARLPNDADSGIDFREYRETSGWIPGQAHSVVFLGAVNDRLLAVGDPSFGRELWLREDLDVLWSGRGIRLTPRSAAQPEHSARLLTLH